MKVCIPSVGNQGLAAAMHDHFGSAPFFTVVDTTTDTVTEVVENTNNHHEHGRCNPVQIIDGHSLDAVICQGMGQGAVLKLNGAGIKVYIGPSAETVEQAVAAFKTGQLLELQPGDGCAGHHHSS